MGGDICTIVCNVFASAGWEAVAHQESQDAREVDPPMALRVVPITRDDANQFVLAWHRHHLPPRQAVFRVGVANDDDVLVGVAICERPKARNNADGMTLEVTRTATDGTPNANSMLYGACWRAAKALGFRRLITYTQEGESGASLRGAGWSVVAERPARKGWHTPSRPRVNRNDGVARTLWEVAC